MFGYVQPNSSPTQGQGTGTVIELPWYPGRKPMRGVVTAFHVIANCDPEYIFMTGVVLAPHKIPLQVLVINPELDLALLAFVEDEKTAKLTSTRFEDFAPNTESCVIGGYAAPTNQFVEGKVSLLNGHASLMPQVNHIQLQAGVANPGNSGGGIFDSINGTVGGVVQFKFRNDVDATGGIAARHVTQILRNFAEKKTYNYDSQVWERDNNLTLPQVYPHDKVEIKAIPGTKSALVANGLKSTDQGVVIEDAPLRVLTHVQDARTNEWKQVSLLGQAIATNKDEHNAHFALVGRFPAANGYLNARGVDKDGKQGEHKFDTLNANTHGTRKLEYPYEANDPLAHNVRAGLWFHNLHFGLLSVMPQLFFLEKKGLSAPAVFITKAAGIEDPAGLLTLANVTNVNGVDVRSTQQVEKAMLTPVTKNGKDFIVIETSNPFTKEKRTVSVGMDHLARVATTVDSSSKRSKPIEKLLARYTKPGKHKRATKT